MDKSFRANIDDKVQRRFRAALELAGSNAKEEITKFMKEYAERTIKEMNDEEELIKLCRGE